LRMLAAYKGATILDVGRGHGQLTQTFVRHGYQVTVLGSAEICQQRIRHLVEGKHCTFQVGNLLALPYPAQAFDAVVSYRLLPHVTRWQQFTAELTRVARRVVLVDYPAVRSVNYLAPLLFSFKKRLEGNTRQFTSFREAELLDLFHSMHFRLVSRYPEFFFPMVLHRICQSPRLSSCLEETCRLLGLTAVLGSPVILQLVRMESESLDETIACQDSCSL